MYNGIGLTTPRGSGTNGYVQRNLSSLRVKRPRDERGGERDEKDRELLESQLNRQPNADILEHQRKRQLEVKCAELQDMMEEQGSELFLSETSTLNDFILRQQEEKQPQFFSDFCVFSAVVHDKDSLTVLSVCTQVFC